VDISLLRPNIPAAGQTLVGQAVTSATGTFSLQIEIPTGQGWEALPEAQVIAQIPGQTLLVLTFYRILPNLTSIPFQVIPSTENRFALTTPTYLAVDSEAAWTQLFGQEPPPISPPVNWQQEIVLGAFLGPQPNDIQLNVTSIVRRENTVSTWLSIPTPSPVQPGENLTNLPRVLVRVPRSALPTPLAQAVFVFLDADGQVLAQGPAGTAPLPTPTVSGEAQSIQALPQQGVAAGQATAVPFETGAATGGAMSQPAATAPLDMARMPGRLTGGWWRVIAGVSAFLAAIILIFAGLGAYTWLRQRRPRGDS
jgi:hypothetical protein